jgi:hypothetical protein
VKCKDYSYTNRREEGYGDLIEKPKGVEPHLDRGSPIKNISISS